MVGSPRRRAWAAAWLTVRGRTFLGARELLDDPGWSGQLQWFDSHSSKWSGHRPDLVALVSDPAIAIEVELATKSKPRLDAILNLHLAWIIARKTNGVIYICGAEEGCRRVERTVQRVGPYRTDRQFRIETLDTIKAQTAAAHDQHRGTRDQAAA